MCEPETFFCSVYNKLSCLCIFLLQTTVIHLKGHWMTVWTDRCHLKQNKTLSRICFSKFLESDQMYSPKNTSSFSKQTERFTAYGFEAPLKQETTFLHCTSAKKTTKCVVGLNITCIREIHTPTVVQVTGRRRSKWPP